MKFDILFEVLETSNIVFDNTAQKITNILIDGEATEPPTPIPTTNTVTLKQSQNIL